ncbi:MAG: L,D-transpeptidase family protein [Epsilonproteobacteria bacterium]|nr:L,D-transpeptidase family protein [Campylobacterota bacterium]
MIKTFLILLILQNLLFSQQVILVVAKDFQTSKAKLTCYEDGKKIFSTIDVNIGKNGLGWGLGEVSLTQNKDEPQKREGDKKAPAGIFKLSSIFGNEKNQNFKMQYLYADKNLICVDDSNSKFYNQIIKMPTIVPKSYENMRRDDNQYNLGVYVKHNKKQISGAGSCIFLHIQKSKNHPTAGCTSMKEEDIKKIASWLDRSKNPILIQIPQQSLKEITNLYHYIF